MRSAIAGGQGRAQFSPRQGYLTASLLLPPGTGCPSARISLHLREAAFGRITEISDARSSSSRCTVAFIFGDQISDLRRRPGGAIVEAVPGPAARIASRHRRHEGRHIRGRIVRGVNTASSAYGGSP